MSKKVPEQLKDAVVIGFDFGMKYIGVAISQTITKNARPLCSLRAKDGIPVWNEIEDLITEWRPQVLIVGDPLNMDGSMQEISFAARKFARRLEHFYKLPVVLVDERMSSKEAKLGNKHKDFDKLNSEAAAIILQRWIDENL